MSENLIYADLNLAETSRPRLQKITDVQDFTYAEVKVQSPDTNAAASYTLTGKSCCSKTCVAVSVAVIILLLALAVCLIFTYHKIVSRPHVSKPFSTTDGKAVGCPQGWEKNGKTCYFFSHTNCKDWDALRKECNGMGSDLVIIDNREELDYLKHITQSRGCYYILGLRYCKNEEIWKWFNNVELSTDMFQVKGDMTDYLCAVIGHGEVSTAHFIA